MCAAVVSAHPSEASAARGGNKRVLAFLSGQVLRQGALQKNDAGQMQQFNPAAVAAMVQQLIDALPPPPPPAPGDVGAGGSSNKRAPSAGGKRR